MTWIWEYLTFDTAMGAAKALAIIAAVFVAAYVLQTAGKVLQPVAIAIRWLFAVQPGRPPSEAVTGIIAGLRIAAWAGILAAALVLVFGRSQIGLWGKSKNVNVVYREGQSHESK
jgi:hypothetical protein